MKTYKGTLTVAIGAKMAYDDIDPPERAGYVNEITKVECFQDEPTAGNYIKFLMGASVKVPARTTMTEAEAYAPDMIVRGAPYPHGFQNSDDVRPIQVMLEPDCVFQDTVRVFMATRDGANSATASTLYYRITVEERKLTDSLRQVINERAYS